LQFRVAHPVEGVGNMDRTARLGGWPALRAVGLDRTGVTSIEYGLIAVVVALAVIAGAAILGSGLAHIFYNVGNGINAAAT
jgi:Flp pilus assembly pilin Flp